LLACFFLPLSSWIPASLLVTMGSASSVAAVRAPPAAVVDALRHLDAALIGLAQVVVTDQAARAFVTGAADHEILSQLKHVDNRGVAALRADLAKAVLGRLKGAGSTSPYGDREAELPNPFWPPPLKMPGAPL
jgi:hypothetical protein